MDQRTEILSARRQMQGGVQSTVVPSGILLGLKTLGDCMGEAGLRNFLGHALLDEIMPCVDAPQKGEKEQLAMALCREMEGPLARQPLLPLMQNGVRAWAAQALPLLERRARETGDVPRCLCFGLSSLMMYFAGARQNDAGAYEGFREGEGYPLEESEEILHAFSRLSCDMPPEMLAYAALSDQDIWGRDLREIPGLEDTLADQLRDLQLLGLRAAMEKAWTGEKD